MSCAGCCRFSRCTLPVCYRRSQQRNRERKRGRVRANRSGKHVTQPGGLHDSREGQGGTAEGRGWAGQGRLSIGGRVRLATTWRSRPISVQQSELVGASMPGPDEGSKREREREMSRGRRGGTDEELLPMLLLLLLCLFAICVNVYEPQLAS